MVVAIRELVCGRVDENAEVCWDRVVDVGLHIKHAYDIPSTTIRLVRRNDVGEVCLPSSHVYSHAHKSVL